MDISQDNRSDVFTPQMAQPNSAVLQVLLIEDNPGDAELVNEMLSEAREIEFRIHWAQALLPGLDQLATNDIDLVLLDMSLPDSRELDGLNAIRVHAPSTPIVLLTGVDSESLALRAVQAGAQDYLVKGTLDGASLARSLRHAIIRQKTRAETLQVESQSQPGTIVGYMGVKGGVGTTTIACHAAMQLRRQTGARVLLMELGAGADPVGFLMKVKAQYSILDACDDLLHLDTDRWKKLVVQGPEGVDIIRSGGFACQDEQQPKAERVRFVLRFVRSLYEWIVVDLGCLSAFSVRTAEDVGLLFLASTFDVLALNETKFAVHVLCQAGFDPNLIRLVLNRAPRRLGLPEAELQRILGVSIDAMLPEDAAGHGWDLAGPKPLVQGREFQKQVAVMAARITGLEEHGHARGPLSSLIGALRNATA